MDQHESFYKTMNPARYPISYSSFENQMLRTSDLRIAYTQRIAEMESKYNTKVQTEMNNVKTFYLNRHIHKTDA